MRNEKSQNPREIRAPKPVILLSSHLSPVLMRLSPLLISSDETLNETLTPSHMRNENETISRLSQISHEQLSQLGMFRDGNGDYFHVSNTEDGGYRLSPATEESVAGAVAGVQRQAKRVQQTQQSALMKKISENAVYQFQVNV